MVDKEWRDGGKFNFFSYDFTNEVDKKKVKNTISDVQQKCVNWTSEVYIK